MTLGQRVAVMRDGRHPAGRHAAGALRSPGTLYVAAFIGSPAMNLVEAEVVDGALRRLRDPLPAARPAAAAPRDLVVGIRPGGLRGCRARRSVTPAARRRRRGRRGARRGHARDLHRSTRRESTSPKCAKPSGDEDVLLPNGRVSFTARVEPRTSARAGRPLRLAVDPVPLPLLRSGHRTATRPCGRSGTGSRVAASSPPRSRPSRRRRSDRRRRMRHRSHSSPERW